MNTLKIINTNDNVEMVIVQLLEYNRLKQENIDLHNKVYLSEINILFLLVMIIIIK